MKSKVFVKQNSLFSLYIPVADLICELNFKNIKNFKYFKKRFYYLTSSPTIAMRLTIEETSKEFTLFSYPDNIQCKINKSNITSLEQLYFIITAIMQHYLIMHNIILLHASSFIQKGKAYVFSAMSGSGKSTIVNSISIKNILSDDIAVIKKKDQKFYVFTSPFDNKQYHTFSSKKAILKKIFFIKQASFTKIVKKNTAETLQEILYNTLLFWWNEIHKDKKEAKYEERQKKLYNIGLELQSFSFIETLYFTKDLSFKDLL